MSSRPDLLGFPPIAGERRYRVATPYSWTTTAQPFPSGPRLSDLPPSRGRAYGRSLADFLPLRRCEAILLEACRKGELAVFNNGKRPETAPDDEHDRLRPGFVRFLCLGGEDTAPVHEAGVQIRGGWIEGPLDLQAAKDVRRLCIFHSVVDGDLVLRHAEIASLYLNASRIGGIEGDGLKVSGNIFLRDGFKSLGEVRLPGTQIGGDLDCSGGSFTNIGGNALNCDGSEIARFIFLNNKFVAMGEVRLLGTRIGGNLDCSGGSFTNPEGDALSCDGADIAGAVFLNNDFTARGTVRLLGTRIGRDLACSGGSFINPDKDALNCDRAEIAGGVFLNDVFAATGGVRLLGTRIGGDLACSGGSFTNPQRLALSCDGATVAGAFHFRRLTTFQGAASLPSMSVGALIDDAKAWTMSSGHNLDGFRYNTIGGGAPTDAAMRIAWLDSQHEDFKGGNGFCPQPWRQLIRTLRKMGHEREARQVAIAFEERRRRAGRVGGHLANGLHRLFGLLAGYGYKPTRLLRCMIGVWLGCALWFYGAMWLGVMAPTNPIVFTHADHASCRPKYGSFWNWADCDAGALEYTTLSPLLYSLDLILPLVDLQQEKDWAPMVQKPGPVRDASGRPVRNAEGTFEPGSKWWRLGLATRIVVWFEILFGWVASLMLVAVVTGFANRQEKLDD